MALPSLLARHFSIARQQLRNHCFTGSMPLFSRRMPGAANYGASVASLAVNAENSTSSIVAENATANDDALATEGKPAVDGGSASAAGASGKSEPDAVGSSEGNKGVVKPPKKRKNASAAGASGKSGPEAVGQSEGNEGVVEPPKKPKK